MTPQHSDLRALAEKATPGEWRVIEGIQDGIKSVTNEFMRPDTDCSTLADCFNYSDSQDLANAEYIAAANPSRILALLRHVEKLEAALLKIAKKPPSCGYAVGTPQREVYEAIARQAKKALSPPAANAKEAT